jgi:hypothetical protein
LDGGHSLTKGEKSYNPIEFWDRLLTYYGYYFTFF